MGDYPVERNYFRIACEFQVRFRVISDEELGVFSNYAMRPSPYSHLRFELENQLQAMDIRDESKFLFEKAFQILMNIDQRLERLEEQMQSIKTGDKGVLESYEWVHGDLGAGSTAFVASKTTEVKVGNHILLDIILPALPEYRFVAAAKVVHVDEKNIGCEFSAIHEDDREFIHRYVIQREREVLRNRAQSKGKQDA